MCKPHLALLLSIALAAHFAAFAESSEELVGSVTEVKGTARVLRPGGEFAAEKAPACIHRTSSTPARMPGLGSS